MESSLIPNPLLLHKPDIIDDVPYVTGKIAPEGGWGNFPGSVLGLGSILILIFYELSLLHLKDFQILRTQEKPGR